MFGKGDLFLEIERPQNLKIKISLNKGGAIKSDGIRIDMGDDAHEMVGPPKAIRIAGVVNDSIVDGPGLRFTVFTQGCPHHCEGCHNPQTWDFDGVKVVEIAEIVEKIRKNRLLTGITLSGGEPFMQALECAEIAREAHGLGLSVWTYTGYTWEKITGMVGDRPQWWALLKETDVLVDGPFIQEEKSLDLLYRGSRNQRLIDVKKSIYAGRVVLWSEG